MLNLGTIPYIFLIYPIWGLVTPLLIAGMIGGLLATILASLGILRGTVPWYSALGYLMVLMLSFAIWQTGEDLVSPSRDSDRLGRLVFGVFALPGAGLLLLRVPRWLISLWRKMIGRSFE